MVLANHYEELLVHPLILEDHPVAQLVEADHWENQLVVVDLDMVKQHRDQVRGMGVDVAGCGRMREEWM